MVKYGLFYRKKHAAIAKNVKLNFNHKRQDIRACMNISASAEYNPKNKEKPMLNTGLRDSKDFQLN